jgi:hypothetical protein
MSGAVFKLVLRDERFDKFFTASEFLRLRLAAAAARRRAARLANDQPTFADIERTHILYVRAVFRPYAAIASEYARVKASGDGTASIGPSGGTIQFTFPTYGHFTSDMAVRVRFRPIGSPTAASPSVETPYLRYCALPGVRLFKNVELRSDQVLIDAYGPDDVVARSKFFVGADQRAGWEKCHGQQGVREAVFLANGYTASVAYRDGAQTPKLYQEGFDIIVPLQFWFCRDAAHALLNDLIPNSQRTVTCELAPLNDIVQALLFGQAGPYLKPAGLQPAELPFSKLGIEAELYVNGLYVNPEIHDVFASRVGFSLIRVHRSQVNPLQNVADAFLLDQLKFPAEYLAVGVRSRRLAADFDRWWLMGAPAARADSGRLLAPALIWNADINACQFVCREAAEVSTLEAVVDTIGVTAHGVEIFPPLPAAFYNAYMPTRYAENSMVVAPIDTSAFLINFCLYPGKFNPSGYYNLSAGRELYVNYALKAGADAAGLEMVVSMSALNFLMRQGDKISLRYSV